MSRRRPWRRICPEIVERRINEIIEARIYIVNQTGPTGFVVKEDSNDRKYKVSLGEEHSCTCRTFQKENELCTHLLWLLIKKFRVPKENPIIFQLSLVEREINEILRGIHVYTATNSRTNNDTASQHHSDKRHAIEQRQINSDDVCPICQEELLSTSEPVSYCKYGCGNNVHIKCIKIWAEHQQSVGQTVIKCPLCREDFGSLQSIKEDMRHSSKLKTRAARENFHLGVSCNNCHQCPITGNCYRCTTCSDFNLCHTCYAHQLHNHHSFNFREKTSQRWRGAPRIGGQVLPDAVISDLANREIGSEDYDMLLQLDNFANQVTRTLPEDVVRRLPIESISPGSSLLIRDINCQICMLPFRLHQYVKRLPCTHKFHTHCIDQWLMHERSTCPIDGEVVQSSIDNTVLNNRGQMSSGVRPNRKINRNRHETRHETPSLAVTIIPISQISPDVNNVGDSQVQTQVKNRTFNHTNLANRQSKVTDNIDEEVTRLNFNVSGTGVIQSLEASPDVKQGIKHQDKEKMSRPPLHPKRTMKNNAKSFIGPVSDMRVVVRGMPLSNEYLHKSGTTNNRSQSAETRNDDSKKFRLKRRLRHAVSSESFQSKILPPLCGNKVTYSHASNEVSSEAQTSSYSTRIRVRKGLAVTTAIHSNNFNNDNNSNRQDSSFLPSIDISQQLNNQFKNMTFMNRNDNVSSNIDIIEQTPN